MSKDLAKKLRHVPHFPKEGIDFIDITPILQDAALFEQAIDDLAELVSDLDFDYIVGAESRGFIFGAALAYKLHKGFIPVRKPGKLPAEKVSVRYEKEYGEGELQIHKDALGEGDRVIIVDDLLATGGTAKACEELLLQMGVDIQAQVFFIELLGLNGRENLAPVPVRTLLALEENPL